MKTSQIIVTVLLLANINYIFAKDIVYISTDNKPLTQSKSGNGSLSYGLNDDEIARRVEMGLADTVPISALKKWQEKKKLENTKPINTTHHNQYTQHNKIQYVPIPNVSTDYQIISNPIVSNIQNGDVNVEVLPKTEFHNNANMHIQNEQDSQRQKIIEFGVLPTQEINTEQTYGEIQHTN